MAQQQLSDGDLVARIIAGSEEDFKILYDRYFKKVYNFTYLKLRNHGDTEELVQEIFYCVFASLKSFEGSSTFLSWVYGIMTDNINNYFRRNRQPEVYLDELELTDPGAW